MASGVTGGVELGTDETGDERGSAVGGGQRRESLWAVERPLDGGQISRTCFLKQLRSLHRPEHLGQLSLWSTLSRVATTAASRTKRKSAHPLATGSWSWKAART
jgi:hypothetical protein